MHRMLKICQNGSAYRSVIQDQCGADEKKVITPCWITHGNNTVPSSNFLFKRELHLSLCHHAVPFIHNTCLSCK